MGSAPTRILVYGVTGSGKTTLAARVGERLGLPWHSVDDLTWEPGWIEVPKDIQRQRIGEICARPAWVLDAAYGSWADLVAQRVELVVGLDFPRWRSLGRLVRRTLRRILTRVEICNGNRESLRKAISRDSILVWHFRSFRRKRERMRRWYAQPGPPTFVLLRSPREAATWLRTLPAASDRDCSR